MEIDAALRIGLDQLGRAGGYVHQLESREIARARVGLEIDVLAVLEELTAAAALQHAAAVDLGRAALVQPENLGVALLGRPLGEAQVALEVEGVAGKALIVLAQERALAALNLDLVEIVPGGVAVVEANPGPSTSRRAASSGPPWLRKPRACAGRGSRSSSPA